MKILHVICLNNSYLKQFTETIPKYLSRDWAVYGYASTEEFENNMMSKTQLLKEDGMRTEYKPGVILAQVAEDERTGFEERCGRKDYTVLWLTERAKHSSNEVFMYQSAPTMAEYLMEFHVNERTMTEAEVMEAWEEAKKDLPTLMLGSNRCADEITEQLVFPKTLPGTNVDLIWMSSDYKLVDFDGNVYPRNASDEGSLVTITVQIRYDSFVSFLDIPIRILRKEEVIGDTEERLMEELQKSETNQANEQVVELPTDVGESPVTFYKKKSRTPWLFGILFLLFLTGLIALWGSEEKRLRKERDDQLLRDYPDLVSKLTLLLQAGLTLRSAWDRITEDYVSAKTESNVAETRYVYEEMRSIRNRLNAGVPEENAYEEFGRNCGNIRYLRLASLLVQNLKKGTGGLIPILRKEAQEAFADRKERVKQKGEEAGTRLLMPMAGILVLILAMIMIPAFMSF